LTIGIQISESTLLAR